MRSINHRSQVPLLEQAREILEEAFQAPLSFDLRGEAFKIIIESWGDDKVDKPFADRVKTILKIQLGLFGTDVTPNSNLKCTKYNRIYDVQTLGEGRAA